MSKEKARWLWESVFSESPPIRNGEMGRHRLDDIDAEGNTALTAAIQTRSPRHSGVLMALLITEPKIDLDLPNAEGDTALHLAIRNEETDRALHLLSAGASRTRLDPLGQTPLHLAAITSPSIFSALLDAATPEEKLFLLSARTRDGKTVLHLTTMYGERETMTKLLAENVDVSLLDNQGQTALSLALDEFNLSFAFALMCLKDAIPTPADRLLLFSYMEEHEHRKFFDDTLLHMGEALLPWLHSLCSDASVPTPQKMFALASLFRMHKKDEIPEETRAHCLEILRSYAFLDISPLSPGLRALAQLMSGQEDLACDADSRFPIFKGSSISFGVEVETYGLPHFMRTMLCTLIKELKILPGYRFIFDGSICPSDDQTLGFEIPTAILNDPRSVAIFSTFLSMLKGLGARTNSSCGLHVHFGTFGTESAILLQSERKELPPITPSEALLQRGVTLGEFQLSVMKQFTLNYLAFQKSLNTTLRRGKAYFSPQALEYAKDMTCTPEAVCEARSVEELARVANPENDRLHTLNFNNLLLSDKNPNPFYTIEVRHREGSIHPDLAVAWVQFLHGMMRHSIERVEEYYFRHFPAKDARTIDLLLAPDERVSELFTEWFRQEKRTIKDNILSAIITGTDEIDPNPWILRRVLASKLIPKEKFSTALQPIDTIGAHTLEDHMTRSVLVRAVEEHTLPIPASLGPYVARELMLADIRSRTSPHK